LDVTPDPTQNATALRSGSVVVEVTGRLNSKQAKNFWSVILYSNQTGSRGILTYHKPS
jgi:hypothetical protein